MNTANESNSLDRVVVPPAKASPQPQVYLQCHNFLSKDLHAELLARTLAQGPCFTPSTVDNSQSQHRRSLVEYDVSAVSSLLLPRVEAVLPQVCAALGVRPRAISQIECQLTAHNDGHYYKLHNDNGTPGTRALSQLCLLFLPRTQVI